MWQQMFSALTVRATELETRRATEVLRQHVVAPTHDLRVEPGVRREPERVERRRVAAHCNHCSMSGATSLNCSTYAVAPPGGHAKSGLGTTIDRAPAAVAQPTSCALSPTTTAAAADRSSNRQASSTGAAAGFSAAASPRATTGRSGCPSADKAAPTAAAPLRDTTATGTRSRTLRTTSLASGTGAPAPT